MAATRSASASSWSGSRPGAAAGAGGGQVPVPLGGQLGDAAEPLGQRGQPVPGVGGGCEPRGAGGQRALELRLAPRRRRRARASTTARRARAAVSSATSRSRASRSCTRSSASSRSRASRRSDCTPAARRATSACLPSGRELAAQLGGEVGQPVEVGLHPVELAERLLLALAVLEDAGGLLDEGAAVLGAAGEDGVELALADDDVHLAADAGVAEQLLDVEQPHLVAVDLVLALAGAVHAAGDRHLGVLDRQRAVGVVDRERHLGAAEGGAAGGAGEDDVLHLAAAQALGALLAEDPGDGVDDVGLARPVGADDGGDPGLEPQRRRRTRRT